MAGVFQDVELEWSDRIYTIKSHRVMGAIYKIENIITLQEFQEYASRGAAPIAKLCGAYGAVLRYAGAKVDDDEIYDMAFRGEDTQEAITAAILNLITLMLPPHAREKLELLEKSEEQDQTQKATLGNQQAIASNS